MMSQQNSSMILQADIIIFLLSRENPCMQRYVFVLGLVDAISIADSRAEGRSSRTQNMINSFLFCSFIGYALYVERKLKADEKVQCLFILGSLLPSAHMVWLYWWAIGRLVHIYIYFPPERPGPCWLEEQTAHRLSYSSYLSSWAIKFSGDDLILFWTLSWPADLTCYSWTLLVLPSSGELLNLLLIRSLHKFPENELSKMHHPCTWR